MPKYDLTVMLRQKSAPTFGQRLMLVAALSWPAIMAQLSAILMEYIDASMVGSLGAGPAASIGLMSTSTWLFWGLGGALSSGFSVQVAHLVGAGKDSSARDVLRQSIIALLAFGLLISAIGSSISGPLPKWLGGNEEIAPEASAYFLIVMLSLPFGYITFLASAMLRCSGNMVVPGMANVAMCVLDVIFNYFLIFEPHEMLGISMPGAGLGVAGAAIGTALAQILTGCYLLYYMMRKASHINFRGYKFTFNLSRATLKRAMVISSPMGAERIMMCGAQILTTVIVAPLGTAAIAANAFGITAESLCYMPGYGVADAATTIVGQSVGASRRDLARSFGKITILIGMVVMTVMGLVMWLGAPLMMGIFTPDATVRTFGVEALRIEAWAEPMFAAAIVSYGVMVGAGYTLVPACINLGCIWAVRLTLATVLAPVMGLNGVWLAMCIELCVRGVVYLCVFSSGRWLKNAKTLPAPEIEELEDKSQPYVL